MADFFIAKGITPELRFDQVPHYRLALIGSDLGSGRPVIYGQDPRQPVLEGLMASIALPPWFAPVEKDGQVVVDGGVVSNLPIEPALAMGATEIVALDLNDSATPASGNGYGLGQFLDKVSFAMVERQTHLEIALAQAQGVPVHYLQLRSTPMVPVWDFSTCRELIEIGYAIAARQISDWSIAGLAELKHSMLVRAI